MGEDYQMKDKLYLERYEIWDDLFPLPNRRRGKESIELENNLLD